MSTTNQPIAVKDKIYAVLENANGATQFIRAHASMAMHVENWALQLMPVRLELAAFLQGRGRDINNFNDVVQYGSLFLTASEDFLRGEHIKQDVSLTEAEKKELREELQDAFSDDKMKDQLMTKAAAIGWVLYDILTPHIDQVKVEAIIQKKLAGIRLNLVSKFASDQIQEVTIQLKKGLAISENLEENGLTVNTDETVSCSTAEVKQFWDKLQDPTNEFHEHKDVDSNEAMDEELKNLNTSIAKMVLECHNIVKM